METKGLDVSRTAERFVVVVDDDPRVRESIANPLHSKAIPVQSFEPGGDALDILCKQSVGCVMSDVEMSDMDGWELQQLIAHAYAGLPAIVITGDQEPQAADRAQMHGVFRIMFKPFNGDEFITAVAVGLEKCVDSLAKPP